MDESSIRLGKIERFLLLYALRQHKRRQDYVGRWTAMSSFVRDGTTYQRGPRSVIWLKASMDQKEYQSLQVRFTRALQRLALKGYVEFVRGSTGVVLTDEGEVIPVDHYDPLSYVLGLRPSSTPLPPTWSRTQGRLAMNRVIYRLTAEGRRRAWAIDKETQTGLARRARF